MKSYLCVCTKVYFDNSFMQTSYNIASASESLHAVMTALKAETTDEFDSVLIIANDQVVAHYQDKLSAYYAEQQRWELIAEDTCPSGRGVGT